MGKRITKPLTEEQKKLVEENLPLAKFFVQKFLMNRGLLSKIDYHSLQDLYQEARMSLFHVARHYDETKGTFSTYAKYWIDACVYRFLKKYKIVVQYASIHFDLEDIKSLIIYEPKPDERWDSIVRNIKKLYNKSVFDEILENDFWGMLEDILNNLFIEDRFIFVLRFKGMTLKKISSCIEIIRRLIKYDQNGKAYTKFKFTREMVRQKYNNIFKKIKFRILKLFDDERLERLNRGYGGVKKKIK